jgi:hypothetical protein
MSFSIVEGQLASDVANNSTFTVAYPSNKDEGAFALSLRHKLNLGNNQQLEAPEQFSLTFGASNITVTNKSGSTWPAGSDFRLQLEELGDRAYIDPNTKQLVKGACKSNVIVISLGAPDAADDDGVAATQAVSAGEEFELNGALVSGGVAVFDVPRNVVASWTTNSVLTVYGEDVYGKKMVESMSAAGTSFTGKKAFKKVTKVTSSASITGGKVGTGDVLGLPVFLPGTGFVLKELENGSAASAGTTVAGDRTAGGNTATSGDVRGTYDPNSACDGDKYFHLVVSLPEPAELGMNQYSA